MTARRWTPALAAQVVEMYLAGGSATEVAEAYGVSAKTVGKWVRKSGHKMRPPKRRPKPPSGEAVQAVSMYLSGCPAREVAEKFGVNNRTIYNWISRSGHRLRPPAESPNRGASGYRGVTWFGRTGMWHAEGPLSDGRVPSLGYHEVAKDAARAVDYWRLTHSLPAINFPDSTDETLAQAERWTTRKTPARNGAKRAVLEALNCDGMTIDEVLARVARLGTTRGAVKRYLQQHFKAGYVVRLGEGIYARAGAPGGEGPM